MPNNIKNHPVLDNNEENVSERMGSLNIFDINVFTVDFSKGVRKFWYIVVVIAILLGSSSAFIKYKEYVPMYSSTVSFSVSTQSYNSNGTAVFSSYYDNSAASQLSRTFPYIINTSMMINALKDELGTNYINGSISAEAVASDSNIFKVSVSSNSAEDAFDIVNAVINVYPDVAVFVVGNVRLNILIKPTIAAEPYTTNNFIRTGIIMALVGTTLGFGIICIYALFRNTVRKKEDFKNKLNQKCYAEIPFVVFHRKSNDKKLKDRIVRITDKHPTFKESFRLLRKRLLRNLKSNEKVIAITSAIAGEGKTTVALNLAHSMAIAGKKTACVDFDLGARSLQRYLDVNEINGFCDIDPDNEGDISSIAHIAEENLHIFFAGKNTADYSDKRFITFIEHLRDTYDYVIVNLAPGGNVYGSLTIGNLCDCLLFVVKQDSASIDKIRKTLEFLSFGSSRILGFVFNCVQEGFSGYGGYYYGGKYGYGRYGYGKYGYGRYGYGKYGYGKYGYGGYGYGDGKQPYGYGYEPEENSEHKHKKRKFGKNVNESIDIDELTDSDIPDNNI